jgi:hypothetical protein
MSKKLKKIVWSIPFVIVLGLTALAFTSTRAPHEPAITGEPEKQGANKSAPKTRRKAEHVKRAQLPPQLRWTLDAMGDRLQKPGKERLTLSGVLTLQDEPQPVPFTAVLQFPDRLRMTLHSASKGRVVSFDGTTAPPTKKSVDALEEDLIELAVYDTAEHFFSAQVEGTSTRFLGDRFRPDDGTDPDYSGPTYSVYQTTDQIHTKNTLRVQTKLYWFNSNTLLLERVTYVIEATQTAVEIRIDWRKVEGQQTPSMILCLKNGLPAAKLEISSATMSPGREDGIFEE